MEDAEILLKKLAESYDKDPVGWKALAVFNKGSTLLVIMSPEGDIYEIKMIALDPCRFIGVGVKTGEIEELSNYLLKLPNYGFRPVPKNVLKEILRNKGILPPKLAERILKIPPAPITDLHSHIIAQGPIVCSNKDLSSISPRQKELEEKLNREVEKLFYKRYRGRALLYG